MFRLNVITACVACLPSGMLDAAERGTPSVRWTLLGNDTPRPGISSAAFELTIDPSRAELRGPAYLYFNFGRKPADEGVAEAGFEHVNGDLFRMKLALDNPDPHVVRRRWIAEGAIRSLTDAPAGFFLVAHGKHGEEFVQALGVKTDLAVLTPKNPIGGSKPAPEQETPASRVATAPVIPQPIRYESMDGVALVDGLPVIVDGDHAAAVELVVSAIVDAGGESPRILEPIDPYDAAIRLMVGQVTVGGEKRSPGDEAYQIGIDPDSGVVVTGSDPTGLYYGAQTLVALLANHPRPTGGPLTLPAARIEDAPHFGYRGLHLDVARNFQSTATVRKLLDLMAAYKLNRFHFHLTDDEGWRLAIRGLPELTSVGGRRGYSPGFRDVLPPSFGSGPDAEAAPGSGHYTRNEFVELLRYAAERRIEVIPEIDLPGHSRAAIRAMRVRHDRLLASGDRSAAERFLLRRPEDSASYESVQMWSDNVIDVRLESTHRFVEHVVGDLASMYDEAGVMFRTVHLGGDEVPRGCWGELPEGEAPALFAAFMDRCASTLRRLGARSAGWEEVFLTEGDADRPARRSGPAADGLCYAWNNIWGWGQEDAAYRLANSGVDVVLCNATHLYFDLATKTDASEPGYYWAGTTDTREVFSFRPYDYLGNLQRDHLGNPIRDADKQGKARLAIGARDRIVGIQGHLWGENLSSPERLEYLAFPRLLALAERAWVGPVRQGGLSGDSTRSWGQFARHAGERELKRLDRSFGGVRYRIPSAQIDRRDETVVAASELPGLTVRYTADGTDPTPTSRRLREALPSHAGYRFRAFDTLGRGGATVAWAPPIDSSDGPRPDETSPDAPEPAAPLIPKDDP